MSERLLKVTISEVPDVEKKDTSSFFSLNENPVALIGNNENEDVYEIDWFEKDMKTISETTAYMYNNFFYIYKGDIKDQAGKELEDIDPGIYLENDKYILIMADENNSYHITKYGIHKNNIGLMNPQNVLDDMKENYDEIYKPSENSTKVYVPVINDEDDELKRLMKQILIEKNIDIDRYKTRFTDKNQLFNFKQVLKGTNKLSMLLFMRGCDAFNLKFTITVEEMNENTVIGKPLAEKIIVTSEDTYDV